MINLLICDGAGTLELPNPSDEIRNLLSILPELNIRLAVASNSTSARKIESLFRKAGLQQPDYIVTRGDMPTNPQTGKPISKPSPLYVLKIQELAGVELHEIVYLGDDDKTDIFCAINAGVLPFAAKYSDSGKEMKYGLPITHPKALYDYLCTYAMQDEPYFGWTCEYDCRETQTLVDIRALLGEHKDMQLTGPLTELLKDQEDITIGSNNVKLGVILFQYLVSQVYLTGLIRGIDCITVYPGHLANSTNPILEIYSGILSQTFRDRYLPGLIERHSDAKKSQWIPGAERDIFEQFRTIQIDPDYADSIRDRSLLVLDDFTTSGASLETARRMLINAGASRVICLAMAKFRLDSMITRISEEWSSFKPCTLSMEDIEVIYVNGSLNRQADDYFQNEILPVYAA